jgi:hypothetical protein
MATSHLCQVITSPEPYSPFYSLSPYYLHKHLPNSYFVLEVLVAVREIQLNGLGHMTGVQFPVRGVRQWVQTGPTNLLYSGNGHRSGISCSSAMSNMEDISRQDWGTFCSVCRWVSSGPCSSVSIVTDNRQDGQGSNLGGDEIFRPSRPALRTPSCKMGTGSFPGVKCGRGVLLTTHPS